MRGHGIQRYGNRGKVLSIPPDMQTPTIPSSPPLSGGGIVGSHLSTPSNATTDTGISLAEHTHNLRKQKKRKDDDEGANMAGGSGLSGSLMSTESVYSIKSNLIIDN